MVAVLVAVLLRAFVVQTFFIPSGSMEPTLQIGDRILVNKLSYHLHGVDRGDIVVFSRPPAENCGGPEVNDLVKRVIGLPGDVVSLSGGYVYIDGKRLDESWLPASEQGSPSPGRPGTAPIWPARTGSRPTTTSSWATTGPTRATAGTGGRSTESLIVGKVELRVWPLSSLHIF